MFKDWLKTEETHRNNIAKVDIFDFDDTLVFTPSSEEAEEILRKHNIKVAIEGGDMIKAVPHHCFAYAHMSLMPPMVPEPCPCRLLNQSIAREFYASSRSPRNLTVVLTGRPPHLEKHVRRILGDFKMSPDRLMMVPLTSKTLPSKIEMISALLDEFPRIKDVEMWDDRGPLKAQMMDRPEENHIAEFKKFLDLYSKYRNKAMKFKINEIPPRNITAATVLKQYTTQYEKEQEKAAEKKKKDKEKAKKKPEKKSEKKSDSKK